ncbi:hypothetical protein [Thermoleptolyngbya sp. M55_K2018_002]|uniref:hypothetical protein n=1 Tax=Thermoleptolyngbya sp. M55_K2018_002 TaxID=2747808 RepID=UPI0025D933FA|nr:hypothetical protein [Thermoleptolyngbya sp. M55_K2018_002]
MYADSEFDSEFDSDVSWSGDDLARLTPAECGQRLSEAALPEAERAGLLCRLGWWQLRDGQIEAAIAQFDQALLLWPDLVAAYHGRARWQILTKRSSWRPNRGQGCGAIAAVRSAVWGAMARR